MTRDDEFVREAQSSLQELTNGLVEVERGGGTREQIDELFRTAHTLKGNCSMAGLDNAGRLAHAIEDFLSELRDGTVTANPELTDAALAAVDDIDAIVHEWHEQGTVETNPEATVSTLRERTHEYRDESAAGSTMQSDDGVVESPPVDMGGMDGFDPSVVEALGSASEFDDLERLLAEMDDPDESGEEATSSWGTFENTADEPSVDEPASEPSVDEPAADEPPSDTAVDTHDEQSGGGSAAAMDEFASIKQDVEAGDISDLDRELVDVKFGEFDDEDNLSIQDLLENDMTDDDPFEAGVGVEAELDDGPASDTTVDADSPARNDSIRLEDFDARTAGDEAAATGGPQETTAGDVTAAETGNTNPFEAADVVDPTDTAESNPFAAADEPAPAQTADAAESAEAPDEFPEEDFPDNEEFALSVDEEAATVEDEEPVLSDDEEDVTVDDGEVDLSDDEVEVAVDDEEPVLSDDEEEVAVDNEEPVLSDDEEEVTIDDEEPVLPHDEAPDLSDDEEAVTVHDGESDLSDDEEVDFSDDGEYDLSDDGDVDFSDDGEFDLSEDGEVDFSDDEALDLPEDDEFGLADDGEYGLDDEEPGLADAGDLDLTDDGEFETPSAEADAALPDDGPNLSPGDAEEDEDFPDIDLPDIDGLGGSEFADTAAAEHASAFDVSFDRDEHTVAFESRFAERFGGGGVDADGTVPLVQSAATTIEDSTLDAARFQSSGPTEYAFDFDTTHQTDRIQSITVDVQNADTLLNLVEELSLTQLRLKQAASDDIDTQLSELDSVASDLRRTVMDLRLMPLSTVVDGLPRVVRDIARQQDKQVAFEVSDEGVHLDRSIVEKLGDPLIHLIRNAVDHGIESPADRERKDKPREGTVELRAWRERERVIIELADDGRGISAERVRQQAIDNDIVSRERAERMPLDEVYDLVFEPGFSTADEVTDVSGRGVGMDAVRRTINSLDGTVSVRSEPDSGTTVQMRLPVSVAVAKMLFIRVGSEEYAIPTSAIDGVEALDEGAVTDDGQVLVERSDDDSDEKIRVSLLRLHEEFGVDADDEPDASDASDAENQPEDGRVLIRLDTDVRRLALLCDEVDDAREVVVKPYEKLLGDVPGISGATMGGDGTLVNIIDVATL